MNNYLRQDASVEQVMPKEDEEEEELDRNSPPIDQKRNIGSEQKKGRHYGSLIVFIVLLLFCSWYIINDLVVKDCMIWKVNQYEAIDCEQRTNNFTGGITVIPLDEETLISQRKIEITDSTKFFLENGEPCIWYSKSNGQLEYYKYPGLHPVTGKTLKPITQYMIEKYVNKSIKKRN